MKRSERTTFHALRFATSSFAAASLLGGVGAGCGGKTTGIDVPSDAAVAEPSRVVALAMTVESTCALLASGHVWCWGDNQYGELGLGTVDVVPMPHPTPTRVPGLDDVTSLVSSGGRSMCALRSGGAVWCWGDITDGAIGFVDPHSATPCTGGHLCMPTPVRAPGVGAADDVALGGAHGCARDTNGDVICWGANTEGQLGHDPSLDTVCSGGEKCSIPTSPTSSPLAGSIALGSRHTCVGAGSDVRCWGANTASDIGIAPEDGEPHPTPHAIAGMVQVTALVAHGDFTCARSTTGRAWCWGSNESAQLTLPYDAQQHRFATPQLVPIDGIVDLQLGFDFACAVRTDATVWCWGDARSGQIGQTTTPTVCGGGLPCAPSPARVAGVDRVVKIASAGWHTCVVDGDNSVWCWGGNAFAELGHAPSLDAQCVSRACATTPTKVAGLPDLHAP